MEVLDIYSPDFAEFLAKVQHGILAGYRFNFEDNSLYPLASFGGGYTAFLVKSEVEAQKKTKKVQE